ncbi:DddA-like double-stranded DNA deaminase toxin [Streptomyces sp. NPDC013082]|uniref:DddA-like double-stranded DNA deaminase toxin n=1 Tax=Streptomyces sp. NPDC013082 TaxID=3156686 RepID=UPI0034102DA9
MLDEHERHKKKCHSHNQKNVGACSTAQNCEEAVAHILPVGSTLTVYYPGSKETLRGSQA